MLRKSMAVLARRAEGRCCLTVDGDPCDIAHRSKYQIRYWLQLVNRGSRLGQKCLESKVGRFPGWKRNTRGVWGGL
jgi:hypothetical protein